MNTEQTINEVLEVVNFLKDNAVPRQEFDSLVKTVGSINQRLISVEENMVTKKEFEQFKTEIYAHIDGFAKRYEAVDQELVVLRSKCERLEEIIFKMAKHLQLDVNQL